MGTPRKDLWCSTCNTYPDEIYTFIDAKEKRVWNGEDYDCQDVEFGDIIDFACVKCGSYLTHRAEEPAFPEDTSTEDKDHDETMPEV